MFGLSKKEMLGEAVTQVVPGFVGAPIRAWFGKDEDKPVVESKKTQIIDQTETAYIDITQKETAYQTEIQAPFTFTPVTEKAYAPVFQVHSPAGEAGSKVTQEASVELKQVLTALQKLSQNQEAEAGITQTQEASQAMKDVAGLPLLHIAIIGALAGGAYLVYKERKPIKKAIKGQARKHPTGKVLIAKEREEK